MNAVSYLDVGWHPGTVLLSVLVATFASYVSLELSRRVRDLDGAVAHAWWLGGSLTMGTGVWSMHFVGMLAFEPPLPLGYRHDLTALSWLAALVAAGMAMAVAGHRQVDRRLHLVASLVMTAGIVSMHYLGMAAIDLQPGIDWDWPLVGASVLIALIASAAALEIFVRMRALGGAERLRAQLRASVVMAAAGASATGSSSRPASSWCAGRRRVWSAEWRSICRRTSCASPIWPGASCRRSSGMAWIPRCWSAS